ncbi:MAG: heme ABC exporter ATP-binding protein CcmA [Alphaproteobacteria bacterium]
MTEPQMPSARLTAHGLACRRGGRLVFAGLDLALDPGDMLVITGANGSGKSSLLRLLAGLVRPAAGRLSWAGQDITAADGAFGSHAHYLGHADGCKPTLSGLENLAFWVALREGCPLAEARVAAAQGLAWQGLEAITDIACRYLSAGQKKRVSLARLAASPAPLWLLDEPTLGLDALAIHRLTGAIEGHLARGGLVIATTHVDLGLRQARFLDLDAHRAARDLEAEDAA